MNTHFLYLALLCLALVATYAEDNYAYLEEDTAEDTAEDNYAYLEEDTAPAGSLLGHLANHNNQNKLLKKGGQSSHGQKGKDNGQKGNGNIIDGVVNHLLSTGQSSHGQKGGVAYHGQKGGGATNLPLISYKGTTKKHGKFVAQIRIAGKITLLGTFDTAIQAALAYDQAAIKAGRKKSTLNFPDGQSSHGQKGKGKGNGQKGKGQSSHGQKGKGNGQKGKGNGQKGKGQSSHGQKGKGNGQKGKGQSSHGQK